MKTKPFSTKEAAIKFAKETLGLRFWDDSPDYTEDYAACWETLGGGKKIAWISRKGSGVKLNWDPEFEKRRPKLIGL